MTVTGFLGRDNQELFCQLFEQLGVQDAFIRIVGATRINVKLVEQNGAVSDINFPGIQVTEADIEAFEATLQRLAQDHDYFVLAGSLPQGISPQRCAGWIAQLRSMNKKVLFDSSRDALLAGLDAKPWLIKPNDEELSQWCGRELTTLTDCQQAAAELAQKQIENIVISMKLRRRDVAARKPMVACKTTQNAGGEHSRRRRYAGCWSMLGTYATYGKRIFAPFRNGLVCTCGNPSRRWSW